MGKIIFMVKLQEGPFKYRNNLGGLCSICIEYGYNVFSNIIKIIKLNINDTLLQVSNYFILLF